MKHSRKSCRQQNIPKRTIKRNEGPLRPRMAAALLLVLFREIWGWDHNPKQLNSQQRGQHRRLGNAHGARDDLVEASCVSFAFVLARKRKIRSLLRRGRRARRARFPTCGVIRVAGYSVVWDCDPTPIFLLKSTKRSAATIIRPQRSFITLSWCASDYSVVGRIPCHDSYDNTRTNVCQ